MYTFTSRRPFPVLGHSNNGAMRMSPTDSEYMALRRTIATRGTVRILLVPLTLGAWSALAAGLLVWSAPPVAVVFSLAVLAAGFEAIHALHAGVERIGRYLQVYYESAPDGPQWETAAMAVGPALPGGGTDPLFTVLFTCAAVFNLLPALVAAPRPIELGVIGALHAGLLVRIVRARLAAGRQRAVELESFRALRSP
jgi:hypothetical protein